MDNKVTTFLGIPISHVGISAPNSPCEGQMYYDTREATQKVYFNGAWVPVMASPMQPLYPEPSDDELCAKNEGLAELKKELEEAKERYEMYKALIKE